MRIRSALILAGGFGTRLQALVSDLPKCLAPVAGRPFLDYLIRFYLAEGIEHFIFSLGYKHELVEDFLRRDYPGLAIKTVVEKEPLGTGGAIHLALKGTEEKDILIANGDTFFAVDINAFAAFHQLRDADCSLALKPMREIDRYGVVDLDENASVQTFREKQYYPQGLINGGMYILSVPRFMQFAWPKKFSFELDYLQSSEKQKKLSGFLSDSYFIDIGVPADYQRAQQEFPINQK